MGKERDERLGLGLRWGLIGHIQPVSTSHKHEVSPPIKVRVRVSVRVRLMVRVGVRLMVRVRVRQLLISERHGSGGGG